MTRSKGGCAAAGALARQLARDWPDRFCFPLPTPLLRPRHSAQTGGLSGKPLFKLATEVGASCCHQC